VRKPLSARLAAAIGIAPEGLPITLGASGLGILLIIAGLLWLGIVVLVVGIACGAFFRDPERNPPNLGNVVLSGADGRVCDVRTVDELRDGLQGCTCVSVFMSPLNVHVNRASVAGQVASVVHTPGEFRAAFRDEAGEHNERNMVIFNDDNGHRHGMMQIAGYLARRIVCRVHANQRVGSGERIGLIMFGSRVDHYMPQRYRSTVKIGDRVRAGESVIGELIE
jgi:phosphatidylserine decarboxylase